MDGSDRTYERRRFLALSTAGALGATALPAWLASAFGACTPPGGRPARAVDPVLRAFDEARRRGRPLLVLIVPENDGARALAGRAWGQALTHGSDELLADLALCDVVCAREASLRAALTERVTLPEELGQAALVETDGCAVRAITCTRCWEPLVPESMSFSCDQEYDAEYTSRARTRISCLQAEFHRAIFCYPEASDVRMEACALAFGLDLNRVWHEGIEATGMDLDRAAHEVPAIVHWDVRGPRSPGKHQALEALSHAAAERLRVEPPEGSRWMWNAGCADHAEVEEPPVRGEEFLLVSCGMGYVPEIGVRFLEFFTP